MLQDEPADLVHHRFRGRFAEHSVYDDMEFAEVHFRYRFTVHHTTSIG